MELAANEFQLYAKTFYQIKEVETFSLDPLAPQVLARLNPNYLELLQSPRLKQVIEQAKVEVIESIVFHADHINNEIYHHASLMVKEKKDRKKVDKEEAKEGTGIKDRLGSLASPVKLTIINFIIAVIIVLVISVFGGISLDNMTGA